VENHPEQSLILQCQRPNCRFRFPLSNTVHIPDVCPKCGGPLKKYWFTSGKNTGTNSTPFGTQVEILLDNIRSTFNIGSIIRSADGSGISHLYFCGITPTPDQDKVRKTALGAESSINWSQHWNAVDIVLSEKKKGKMIWSLETSSESVSIFDALDDLGKSPVILVVGNEVAGVDPEIISLSDKVIHLPMKGKKRSFNVAIACSIAIYIMKFAQQL